MFISQVQNFIFFVQIRRYCLSVFLRPTMKQCLYINSLNARTFQPYAAQSYVWPSSYAGNTSEQKTQFNQCSCVEEFGIAVILTVTCRVVFIFIYSDIIFLPVIKVIKSVMGKNSAKHKKPDVLLSYGVRFSMSFFINLFINQPICEAAPREFCQRSKLPYLNNNVRLHVSKFDKCILL